MFIEAAGFRVGLINNINRALVVAGRAGPDKHIDLVAISPLGPLDVTIVGLHRGFPGLAILGARPGRAHRVLDRQVERADLDVPFLVIARRDLRGAWGWMGRAGLFVDQPRPAGFRLGPGLGDPRLITRLDAGHGTDWLHRGGSQLV